MIHQNFQPLPSKAPPAIVIKKEEAESFVIVANQQTKHKNKKTTTVLQNYNATLHNQGKKLTNVTPLELSLDSFNIDNKNNSSKQLLSLANTHSNNIYINS